MGGTRVVFSAEQAASSLWDYGEDDLVETALGLSESELSTIWAIAGRFWDPTFPLPVEGQRVVAGHVSALAVIAHAEGRLRPLARTRRRRQRDKPAHLRDPPPVPAATITRVQAPTEDGATLAFAAYYRGALSQLGHELTDDDASADDDTGQGVAASLRAWHRVAGRSRLNDAHNRILPLDSLERRDGRTVFAIENQESVLWGYAAGSGDDPPVQQGQPDGDALDWYDEGMRLSEFLVDMIRHTVVAE